jgi:putative transposase
LEEQKSHFLIRKLPSSMINQNSLLAKKLVCTVRGDLKKGRRPYVQIDRAHYTSPLLANSGHLIKQKIIVEIIDEDDFRYVTAYLKNGASIGVLSARGRWSKTKHSRKTRKIINGLLTKRLLVASQFDDPILVYRDYLSTPRKTKSKKRPVITAQHATELARIGRESGIDLRVSTQDKSITPSEKNHGVQEYICEHPYAQSLSTPSIAVIKIKKKK